MQIQNLNIWLDWWQNIDKLKTRQWQDNCDILIHKKIKIVIDHKKVNKQKLKIKKNNPPHTHTHNPLKTVTFWFNIFY